ncbi:hypothetical protein OSTOST_22325 [Ostertagia ostertagi]
MFPMFYRSMFSDRITPLLLLAISFISLLYFAVYFMGMFDFVDGCSFYYDHQYKVWTFGVEQCSQKMAFYIDMCYNVSIFVVICGIDMVVFVHLRSATKKMIALTGTAAEAHNKRRLRKETRLSSEVRFNLQVEAVRTPKLGKAAVLNKCTVGVQLNGRYLVLTTVEATNLRVSLANDASLDVDLGWTFIVSFLFDLNKQIIPELLHVFVYASLFSPDNKSDIKWIWSIHVYYVHMGVFSRHWRVDSDMLQSRDSEASCGYSTFPQLPQGPRHCVLD